jgi:hypothetical protein
MEHLCLTSTLEMVGESDLFRVSSSHKGNSHARAYLCDQILRNEKFFFFW